MAEEGTNIPKRDLEFSYNNTFTQELTPSEETTISGQRKRRGDPTEHHDKDFLVQLYGEEHIPRTKPSGALSEEQRELAKVKNLIRDKVYSKNRKLSNVFRTFDTDASGAIDYSEFRAGLAGIGIEIPENQFHILVSEIDKGKTGRIEFADFAQAFQIKDYE